MLHKPFGRVQELPEKDMRHGDFMFPVLSRSDLAKASIELLTADFPLLDVLTETEVPPKTTADMRIV